MAENFIFEVGGNIDGFKKTISQVEAELKRVRSGLKDQLGQGLIDANKNIAQLEQSIVNLKQVGLDKLPQATNRGSAALFSLSQVARDAPFGFIAIQNNLPLVIDQFTALSKSSGGLKGALKDIGTALIGPAGLSFAFGAAIAGITALVQKYGSLGEAFKQILGLTPKLTEAQKSFNDASFKTSATIGEENAKLNILLKTLNNSKKPQEDRLAAYNEIKTVFPDVVAGIRDENALTERSIELINSQANARKELLRLKVTESGINAALQQNEQKLAELNYQRTIAQQRANTFQTKYNNSLKNQNGLAAQAEQGINTYKLSLNAANSEVADLDNQITQLNSEQKIYLDQLDPIINGIAKINANTQNRVVGLKKEIAAEKELNKIKKVQIDDRKELIDIDEISDRGILGRKALSQLRERFNKEVELYRLRKKQESERGKITTDFQIDFQESLKDFKGPEIGDVIKKDILDSYKTIQEQTLKLGETVKNTVENFIAAPLSYVFDTILEQGKFSWKEFGKIVLQQLAAILSRIIATSIAIAAADAITKGGYSATMKVLDRATGGGGVGRGAGIGINRSQAVNFGGVNAGGLAMTGAVSLSLRGADLVGALNRTNTNINRIG